jgi:hypothetical protein
MAACSGGSIDSSAENDTLPFCAFGQQALGEDAGRGKPAKLNPSGRSNGQGLPRARK